MAVSASFHRNLLLLSQIIPPSDEFKKYFREGMFDKPNTAGFLHTSHYLLSIYDSERFKKLVEWPVICKKTEAKYRNSVKDFLTVISVENPDIDLPNILMSHLIHAGGNKFTIIMWKLSELATRKYITRETTYNVIFAPQIGTKGKLAAKFLQETNAKIRSSILSCHKNLSEMQDIAKIILEEEKEILNNTIAEVFEQEQLLTSLLIEAPVHPSIKKCLMNTDDEEVIQKWKNNINDGINRIKRRNAVLKDVEQLNRKVNDVIISNSSDAKVLDAKRLENIECIEISELFSPDVQCLLFQLYKDDKLVFHNFMLIFNSVLTQLHQRLKIHTLEDFSECLLQIDASCKDLKAALNIIETYLLDTAKMVLETQDILCQKSVQIHDDTVLPIMNNALLMLSPLLKIDTNCSIEENDLQKQLQFTPVEAAHKSLFSRYERLKENQTSHGSKLRENLLLSRINFDDTISTINSEKPYLHTHSMSVRRKLSSFKQADKYSRLFSTRTNRSNPTANSSIMSIPYSSKANSTAIVNTIEEMHDMSELCVNISSRSLCNISIQFATPEKRTVKNQNKSDNACEMEDVLNALPVKPDAFDICEMMEVAITNSYDACSVKAEQTKQRRRSIGDLVERYKKLLVNSNRTPSPKLSYFKCNDE